MQYLNAPWRDKYFNEKPSECAFCSPSEALLYSDDFCKVIMNKYPYSPGHILIIPHEHKQFLSEISLEVWLRMSELARFSERLMREVLHAQGVNIGLNLGEAAGAGIAPHLHLHVLPRWHKDTNFITTIANTRVLGTSCDELYIKLKEKFNVFN